MLLENMETNFMNEFFKELALFGPCEILLFSATVNELSHYEKAHLRDKILIVQRKVSTSSSWLCLNADTRSPYIIRCMQMQ